MINLYPKFKQNRTICDYIIDDLARSRRPFLGGGGVGGTILCRLDIRVRGPNYAKFGGDIASSTALKQFVLTFTQAYVAPFRNYTPKI